MLIGHTELKTYQVVSAEGEIGRLVDIVFPRGQWSVRYLVAWSDALDREIALPPSQVMRLDRPGHVLEVDVRRDRVEASPELDLTRRIERYEEEQLYEHYGWPPYWLQEENDVTPIGILSGEQEQTGPIDERETASPELQLANEVIGAYAVHANEGPFGVLQDVLVESETWMVSYVAVSAPPREGSVLVETDRIERVDWIAQEMYVSLPIATLLEGPAYDPNEPLNPELERSLHEYYDRISRTV
jgi:hypothetical protein